MATRFTPRGDSFYARAKHAQLVEKNLGKAVSMFRAAINSDDQVESALKDMVLVMKQLNRFEEAIEAIKSFGDRCSPEAAESLEDILFELYERSGRTEEHIHLLKIQLKRFEDVKSSNRRELPRWQGPRIRAIKGRMHSRKLRNLAWLRLLQDDYKRAQEGFRKALSIDTDKNTRCCLAICLMYMDKMEEAESHLRTVKDSDIGDEESYAMSYKRAILVRNELKSKKTKTPFSLFLSGNKDSGSVDDEKRGKRIDLEGDFGRSYVSPVRTGGTQHRVADGGDWRRERDRTDSGGRCSYQNLESKMTRTPSSELRFSKTDGFVDEKVKVDVGKCKAEEDDEQMVLGGTDRKRADSGERYFRKVHFEQTAEVKSTDPLIDREMSNKVTTEAGESKKSCADMAEEEDEQIVFKPPMMR